MTSEPRTEQKDGVFIEVGEGDPFAALQMRVMTNDGEGLIAGGIVLDEPGRYELRKVEREA